MTTVAYPTWDEMMTAWEEFIKCCFGAEWTAPMMGPELPTFMGRPHVTSPDELKGADAVIIGAPYVATATDKYAGVDRNEWLAAPRRVRQQSIRYQSGYIQDFDLDVFDHLKVVDYGDAAIPPEVMQVQSAENILRAQAAVEEKVGHAIDAGAVPVVIGQNSPCSSYAIAKPIAERTQGNVGCVSLDTHWDSQPIDRLTDDPRIAGSGSWKHKMYEFHDNMHPRHLVEIGERGMLEQKETVRRYLRDGARFISTWEVRTSLGIEGLVGELDRAYDGTEAVYAHLRHGRDGRRRPVARRPAGRGCRAHSAHRLRDHPHRTRGREAGTCGAVIHLHPAGLGAGLPGHRVRDHVHARRAGHEEDRQGSIAAWAKRTQDWIQEVLSWGIVSRERSQ